MVTSIPTEYTRLINGKFGIAQAGAVEAGTGVKEAFRPTAAGNMALGDLNRPTHKVMPGIGNVTLPGYDPNGLAANCDCIA